MKNIIWFNIHHHHHRRIFKRHYYHQLFWLKCSKLNNTRTERDLRFGSEFLKFGSFTLIVYFSHAFESSEIRKDNAFGYEIRKLKCLLSLFPSFLYPTSILILLLLIIHGNQTHVKFCYVCLLSFCVCLFFLSSFLSFSAGLWRFSFDVTQARGNLYILQ